MLKILTLLNSAVNLPRDPCQGHREFPSGIPWNSREFAFIKFPAGIPGNLAYRIFIFFSSGICTLQDCNLYSEINTFHSQVYTILYRQQHKTSKKIRASTINGPWELIKPAILGALTTLHSS